ncbi:MAG TPA: hypothetical protein VFQ92_24985 [Blastocatellia bacterium]|nr:hypothetical protein [Blastocatellia bacterium]
MNRCSQKVGVLLLSAFLLIAGLFIPASAEQKYGAADPATEKDPTNRVDTLSGESGDVVIRRSTSSDDTLRNELKTSPPLLAPGARKPAFDLSKIDDSVLESFKKAWRVSKAGTMGIEGVVLVFLNGDGSYYGESQGQTNQYKAFTFTWRPNAIAIVHNHPNTSDPRPHHEDIKLADRLKVPIITLTNRGMYMYDPGTKEITKVLDGVEWLDFPRAYQQRLARAGEAGSAP